VPDRVVAEKAGVTVGAVQHYRTKLGLSAHGRRKVAARPALQPTTPSSPPQGILAWKVTLAAGDVMVVAAESLTASATRSVTLGEVLALERVVSTLTQIRGKTVKSALMHNGAERAHAQRC